MRYPLWFPFPSCWLKAMILEVSMIPLTIVLRVVGESAFNALEVAWHDDRWRFWTWVAIAGCLTPVFVLSHMYQLLWGEPSSSLPKWIPAARSWVEGFWMWFVCVAAIAISGSILFFAHLVKYDFKPPLYQSKEEIEFMGNLMAIGFFIISAYWYHARELTQRFLNNLKLKFDKS
jgi:hypothetical protein